MTPQEIISRLQLQPHPVEGGFFRETYRSVATLPKEVLPSNPGPRSLCTAIYYLLTPTTVSALHRLPTDEIFHFYLGHPVRMLQLWPDGSSKELVLGTDLLAGQVPQTVVPGGVWQGSMLDPCWGTDYDLTHNFSLEQWQGSLEPDTRFALLGATMAPGFDYADYQSGNLGDLRRRFPGKAELIRLLLP